MKFSKVFFALLIFITTSSYTFAQKIGVVDTNYILSKLPQYKEAQTRLDGQIKAWEQEMQKLQSEYDTKKTTFENEKVLLVGDQLKQRETEVKDLDKRIKKFVAEKFSGEGEINKFRANLAKPFQDQIWNAIKTVTEKNSLGIVLDKSNNISVIYLDKKYDYTDKVLDILLKGVTDKDKNNKDTKDGGKSSKGNTKGENVKNNSNKKVK